MKVEYYSIAMISYNSYYLFSFHFEQLFLTFIFIILSNILQSGRFALCSVFGGQKKTDIAYITYYHQLSKNYFPWILKFLIS